jgi:FtsZ-binding cell division protein ZapB
MSDRDLIELLHAQANALGEDWPTQAADRLQALSAEVERLKADNEHQQAIATEHANEVERYREALATCDDAIREYFRYFYGGEMRGSYDGKPERAQLQKAGHAATQALKGANNG